MKYEKIDKELYIHNRARFVKKLKSNSLAIFNSNDIITTSADSSTPFVQHRDILHLCGVDQEESILVIFPDCFEEKHREVLFLKETSDLIAVWEGAKLDKEQAFETSGVKTVYWLSQFESVFNVLMAEAQNVYVNTNEHTRANTEAQTREDRFVKKLKKKYPAHTYERSAPIMHEIRSIKHPIEIELMQKACDITEKVLEGYLVLLSQELWNITSKLS